MTRRRLLIGSAIIGSIALTSGAGAQPKRGVLPRRQAPTMDQLINLQQHTAFTKYYSAVFTEAMKVLGDKTDGLAVSSLVVNGDQQDTLYVGQRSNIKAPLGNYLNAFSVRVASAVLVPDVILPMIRPEHRGEDFPKDVPFAPLEVRNDPQ